MEDLSPDEPVEKEPSAAAEEHPEEEPEDIEESTQIGHRHQNLVVLALQDDFGTTRLVHEGHVRLARCVIGVEFRLLAEEGIIP